MRSLRIRFAPYGGGDRTESGTEEKNAMGTQRLREKSPDAAFLLWSRRFLADSEDFSEENVRRAGITKQFENNGDLEDCVEEIRKAILENTP